MAPKRSSTLRTNARTASVADLPEEVLIVVFGHLDLKERHRTAAQVCRRWHRAANSARLLRCLDVSLSGSSAPSERKSFVGRLRALVEWLVVRAVPHVQQLGLELLADWGAPAPGEEDLEAEVRAALPAMLAACAAGGQLTRLHLHHDCGLLPISIWLAGLGRSLQQLTVISELPVSVTWLALPALRELSLEAPGNYVEIPDDVRLPATLTKLCLSNLGEGDLTPQIGTLTRLQELCLCDSWTASDEFKPLAELSATLTSLGLQSPFSLPACLGQLTALQALDVTFPLDGGAESTGCILRAALPRLTALTRLELSSMPGAKAPPAELASLRQLATFKWYSRAPEGATLPGGPWLTSLQHVHGPPELIASSLKQLTGAGQLSELVVTYLDGSAAAAALDILHWAAHRPSLRSLALRSVTLPYKVANAAVWLKGLRPGLDIHIGLQQ